MHKPPNVFTPHLLTSLFHSLMLLSFMLLLFLLLLMLLLLLFQVIFYIQSRASSLVSVFIIVFLLLAAFSLPVFLTFEVGSSTNPYPPV